jgi:hypothetical protein
MLDFQNVSSSGFTVVLPDGTTYPVAKSFDNGTGDGFVYYDSLLTYFVSASTVTACLFEIVMHTQKVPSQTWLIKHNLTRLPLVTVNVDYDGVTMTMLAGAVTHVDANTVSVTFTTPHAGTASLK